MQILIYIIIGVGVGLVAGLLIKRSKSPNQAKIEERQKHLNQIIEYLDSHDEIATEQVEKMCLVSEATSVRYFDSLEQAGKIVQVGKTGRNVVYRRK